jgi:hypothetical protein
MQVDLREKLKKDKMMRELPKNHRELFEERLQKELPQKAKNNYGFLKIAASVLILLSLGVAGYQFLKPGIPQEIVRTENASDKKINSMADISPDFKKVEDFYLSRINYQLAKIRITDENRDLLELYLSQLSVLQQEYQDLNLELSTDEISEATIEALIENLQLRLQLLKQLKKKLEIIENLNSQENENKQA